MKHYVLFPRTKLQTFLQEKKNKSKHICSGLFTIKYICHQGYCEQQTSTNSRNFQMFFLWFQDSQMTLIRCLVQLTFLRCLYDLNITCLLSFGCCRAFTINLVPRSCLSGPIVATTGSEILRNLYDCEKQKKNVINLMMCKTDFKKYRYTCKDGNMVKNCLASPLYRSLLYKEKIMPLGTNSFLYQQTYFMTGSGIQARTQEIIKLPVGKNISNQSSV